LQAKEEEAQATWLFVFTQGYEQETESWLLELSNILAAEANRQLELENLEISWLIRKHLQEINPGYLDNLLHLTLIEIKLNRFDPQQLQEWQILELITQGSVNAQLLERVVIAVIPYGHKYTIELVRLSLPYLGNSPELLNYVITVAGRFAFEKYQAIYSVDLAEAFLPLYPESLYLEVNLFWFYISLPDYEKAINLVNKLKEKSQTIDLKMFSQSLLFSGSLRASKWNDIPSICQDYKHLIQEFLKEKTKELTCQFCSKEFKTKYLLHTHQTQTKYCLKIQESQNSKKIIVALVSCKFCNKNFSSSHFNRHDLTCKKKNKSLIEENTRLKIEKAEEISSIYKAAAERDRAVAERAQATIDEIAKRPTYQKNSTRNIQNILRKETEPTLIFVIN
jgi:hypothetical protein